MGVLAVNNTDFMLPEKPLTRVTLYGVQAIPARGVRTRSHSVQLSEGGGVFGTKNDEWTKGFFIL